MLKEARHLRSHLEKIVQTVPNYCQNSYLYFVDGETEAHIAMKEQICKLAFDSKSSAISTLHLHFSSEKVASLKTIILRNNCRVTRG